MLAQGLFAQAIKLLEPGPVQALLLEQGVRLLEFVPGVLLFLPGDGELA